MCWVVEKIVQSIPSIGRGIVWPPPNSLQHLKFVYCVSMHFSGIWQQKLHELSYSVVNKQIQLISLPSETGLWLHYMFFIFWLCIEYEVHVIIIIIENNHTGEIRNVTCLQVKTKLRLPWPYPTCAMFEACLDDDELFYAADIVSLSVSTVRYPTARVIHLILCRILLVMYLTFWFVELFYCFTADLWTHFILMLVQQILYRITFLLYADVNNCICIYYIYLLLVFLYKYTFNKISTYYLWQNLNKNPWTTF